MAHYLNMSEAATMLGLSERSVRLLAQNGKLESTRFGNAVAVTLNSVHREMASRERKTDARTRKVKNARVETPNRRKDRVAGARH